jgi:hypothetical protein
MKSLHYGNPGNRNLKGKKPNREEAEHKKEDRKEIQKMLGYSRISSSSPKY